MVCRFINLLPRGWRYRAQRLWMHARNGWEYLWQTPPALLFQMALIAPITGLATLWILALLAPVLTALLIAYGCFLLLLAGCRTVALWRQG